MIARIKALIYVARLMPDLARRVENLEQAVVACATLIESLQEQTSNLQARQDEFANV